MYLHLGQDVSVSSKDIIAILDLENTTISKITREFLKTAEEEGFAKVATAFKLVSIVEKTHEERYRKLLQNLENDEVFKRSEKMVWTCRQCGYVHYGEKALANCPCCGHPQAYFELKAYNY